VCWPAGGTANPSSPSTSPPPRCLAATWQETANYIAENWRTVAFDGHALTVARPQSLGGGVQVIEPAAGRYLVGWGLAWHRVDPAHCDRVVGLA
jgi:hypothetical protein